MQFQHVHWGERGGKEGKREKSKKRIYYILQTDLFKDSKENV